MDTSQPALCLRTHASLLLESCSSVPEAETPPHRSRILSSSCTHLHPLTDPIRFSTQTDPGAHPVSPPSRPPSPFRPPGLPIPLLAPSRVTFDTFLRNACSDCCQGRRRTQSTSRALSVTSSFPRYGLIAPTPPPLPYFPPAAQTSSLFPEHRRHPRLTAGYLLSLVSCWPLTARLFPRVSPGLSPLSCQLMTEAFPLIRL